LLKSFFFLLHPVEQVREDVGRHRRRAAPAFRGGTVVAPITIYMAGRATTRIANEEIPLKEIVIEGSRRSLRENLHAVDAEHHVEIQS
jgi:S-adenosylmethionine synthetase